MSQCDAFGLLPSEAAADVAEIIAVVNTWRDHFAHTGASQSDILSLAKLNFSLHFPRKMPSVHFDADNL